MPRRASMSIVRLARLRRLASVPANVCWRSRVARKLTHRSSTRTAAGNSESYGKIAFPGEKDDGTDEERHARPCRSREHVAARGVLALEHLLERAEERV